MPTIAIRHFTDPGCPFAFSAEPHLRRLEWLYGDNLSWDTRMVVLSESPDEYLEKGFTPAKQSGALRTLFERYGMPIDWRERDRMHATATACRAVVATRVHAPETEAALLRRLRVLTMAGGLLDDPEVLGRAASDVGLDPNELERWMEDPEVDAAVEADKEVARSPAPAALALDHKLADADDGRRYTCPSLELSAGDGVVALPGFQPAAVYEAAIANLDPSLPRRDDPATVQEVLDWAGYPLATAEVAAVCGREIDDVRAELSTAADFEPVGGDGYWTTKA